MTLSIIAGSVQRIGAGASQPEIAADGMSLAVGDRIITGPNSHALVTFLDGSTLAIAPESDVVIKEADVGGGDKGSRITVFINLGTVWGRVVRLLDPKASFTLESNTATASVHDGLPGGRVNPDGSFDCWTRGGDLTVKGKQGEPLLVLKPGEITSVPGGRAPVARPFRSFQSNVKITAPEGVLPLLQMPDSRVLGFVAPGIEVNQVAGSLTTAAEGSRVLEAPGGFSGPFTLVLEGQQGGGFKVDVVGQYQGNPVYRQELSGTLKQGERLSASIVQQIEPANPVGLRERLAARVMAGEVTPLQPLAGPLPGKMLLSPTELEAVRGPDRAAAFARWAPWAAIVLVLLAGLGGGFWVKRRRSASPPRTAPATSS